MKMLPWSALVLMFAVVSNAGAQVPLWRIGIEVLMVRIPTGDALSLVPALRDSRLAEAAVADLRTRIEKGTATLVAAPVLQTLSGNRVASESIEELRYPTEFDPPQFPGGFGTSPRRPFTLPDGVPTAFETRNLGATVEIEPVVTGDGKWIDMSITPMHVSFLRFDRFKLGKTDWGGHGFVDQPRFFTAKTTTQLRARSGQWSLLGTFVVPGPDAQVELFIIRATAQSLTQ